jgi:hypothetical protein
MEDFSEPAGFFCEPEGAEASTFPSNVTVGSVKRVVAVFAVVVVVVTGLLTSAVGMGGASPVNWAMAFARAFEGCGISVTDMGVETAAVVSVLAGMGCAAVVPLSLAGINPLGAGT